MPETPEKIEALKNRWLLDPSFGLMRPQLIEALRAIQDGDRHWEEHLEGVPYADEIENGRDLRGVDFSSIRGMGLRFMRDGFLDLRNADFYRAHLEHSNLYRIHLHGANLYSAFLDGANLRNTHFHGAVIEYLSLEHAKLHQVDLRGFDLRTLKHLNTVDMAQVRLDDAVLDREQFLQDNGEYKAYNEIRAFNEYRTARVEKRMSPVAVRYFEEAREVYLALKNNLLSAGKYQDVSWAACKEKEMEKMLLALHIKQGSYHGWQLVQRRLEHAGYSLYNALFKYGENPWRLIWWALGIIILAALLFPLSGFYVGSPEGAYFMSYAEVHSLRDWFATVMSGLYFSVITFTTVGYGDVTPVGKLSHTISACTAMSGMLFFGLFVFTLGRKVAAR
jgi:hypothetical protein